VSSPDRVGVGSVVWSVPRKDIWKLGPEMRRVAMADPYRPPDERGVTLYCMHCEGEFKSEDMEYVWEDGASGGFWMCPNAGCEGAGFGMDCHLSRWWVGEAEVPYDRPQDLEG